MELASGNLTTGFDVGTVPNSSAAALTTNALAAEKIGEVRIGIGHHRPNHESVGRIFIIDPSFKEVS